MRVGILGLGSIGDRHRDNLLKLGHQVICFDPFHGGMASDRDRALEQADALVIATPTICHYRDLLDCMETGKPTFVEKPIAATRFEWEVLRNCKDVNRLFVGYNLRFHPCVRQAREWLAHGAIGDALYATYVCAQENKKYTDDLILNWSHEIDLACHLFGDGFVKLVFAERPEEAAITLWHDGGGCSHIYLNYITTPQHRGFRIIGSEGAIAVNLAKRHAVLLGSREHSYFVESSWDDDYRDEIAAFVRGEPSDGCTGVEALAVLNLCLDARDAA